LKQGFCNYYATAEVILLRSVGIPARLAVGYAQGDNVDDPLLYTVRQRDAHAWPEVYFPGVGWVEFEPTASQPTLVRPQEITVEDETALPILPESLANIDPQEPDRGNINVGQDENAGLWQSRIVLILAIGLGIALVALLVQCSEESSSTRKCL